MKVGGVTPMAPPPRQRCKIAKEWNRNRRKGRTPDKRYSDGAGVCSELKPAVF